MKKSTRLLDSYFERRHHRFYFYLQESKIAPAISETTVPHLIIDVPIGFIRKYNHEATGVLSRKLPEPKELGQFLLPNLKGRGLKVESVYGDEVIFEEALYELGPEEDFEFWYERNRKGRIELNIRPSSQLTQ